MKTLCVAGLCLSLLLMSLAVAGCSPSGNTDPKARVEANTAIVESEDGEKRPEPTPPRTDVDLSKLPAIEELEKLIVMTQLEVSSRLSSHRFDATLAYTTGSDHKSLDLQDNYAYAQAANGDFHLKVYNDKANKFELYWVGGKLYDRMGDVGFRYTKSDGKHNYWREKISGGLDRFYRYYRGHLTFSAPKDVTYEGRPALRVDFSVKPDGKTPEEELKVKHPFPNQYLLSAMAVDRMIDDNRRRVTRHEKGDGYLIIDKQAQAIVAYEIDARYVIPVSEERRAKLVEEGAGDPPAEVYFTMKAELKIKDFGAAIPIEVPPVEPPVQRDPPAEPVDALLPEGIAPIAPAKPESAGTTPAAEPPAAEAPSNNP